MAEKYPLAQVLQQLGQELREVQRLGREDRQAPIVAVTAAKATLAVAITQEGGGKLSFAVLGIGVEGGGSISKETTTTLEVDLHVLRNFAAAGWTTQSQARNVRIVQPASGRAPAC